MSLSSGSVYTNISQNSDAATSLASYDFASPGTSRWDLRKQARLLEDIRKSGALREIVYQICESKYFTFGLFIVIIGNTTILALQTEEALKLNYSEDVAGSGKRCIGSGVGIGDACCLPEPSRLTPKRPRTRILAKCGGWYFSGFDSVFLGIYIMEIILKGFVYRLSFFRDGWNIFDLAIIFTSLATTLLPLWTTDVTATSSSIFRLLRLFRAVRVVRSFRILKTIKFFSSLQLVVATLLKSLPAMGNICLLTLLVMYTGTVVATSLFGHADPRRFGSIGEAAWTLFQLATLDNWSAIYIENRAKIPGMFFFTFVYIILVNFVFINLFVAVIVDNMQSAQSNAVKKHKTRRKSAVFNENVYDIVHCAPNELQAKITNMPDSGGSEPLPDDKAISDIRDALGIDNYYGASNSVAMKYEFSNYYMLLASLEANYLLYQQQLNILNGMVGLTEDKGPPEGEG